MYFTRFMSCGILFAYILKKKVLELIKPFICTNINSQRCLEMPSHVNEFQLLVINIFQSPSSSVTTIIYYFFGNTLALIFRNGEHLRLPITL